LLSKAVGSFTATPLLTVSEAITSMNAISTAPLITTAGSYRCMDSALVMQNHQSNDSYGRYFSEITSTCLTYAISDAPTTAEKEDLVTGIISRGIQDYYVKANTSLYPADGGHWQGRVGAVMAALHWVGNSSLVADLETNFGGNELRQPFKFDSAAITAATTSNTMADTATTPCLAAKQKTVASVTATTITVNPMGSSESASDISYNNLLIKDNAATKADVVITGYSGNTFTVASHTYVASDVIYCVPRFTPNVGDFDWTVRGDLADYFGTNSTDYRNLQMWTGNMVFAKSIGTMHPNLDAFEGYVVLAAGSGPGSGVDYTSTHSGTASAWFGEFYDTYWSGDIENTATDPAVSSTGPTMGAVQTSPLIGAVA
jgi:hypothetical protein